MNSLQKRLAFVEEESQYTRSSATLLISSDTGFQRINETYFIWIRPTAAEFLQLAEPKPVPFYNKIHLGKIFIYLRCRICLNAHSFRLHDRSSHCYALGMLKLDVERNSYAK